MFSSEGIQKINISMSKIAAMRRIICNGLIVSPLIDFLMTASTTAELSHARRRRPPAHSLCQRMKACRIANISFQSICFSRWRDETRSENIRPLNIPPIPLVPLASVAASWLTRDKRIIDIEDQAVRKYNHHRISLRAVDEMRVRR